MNIRRGPEFEWVYTTDDKTQKQLEEWEEEDPTGTRVLKKVARNSKRKRMNDDGY